MGMYTFAMLLKWLDGVVVDCHPGGRSFRFTGGIRLLDPQEILDPTCVYVGEPAVGAELIRSGKVPQDGVTMVLSAGERLEGIELPKHLFLLQTDLPLIPLYNRLQQGIHAFWDWDRDLQQVIFSNSGLQELLTVAKQLIPATILLVNNGFKRIASVHDPQVKDAFADELLQNGYQSFDTVQAIRRVKPLVEGTTARGEFVEYLSAETGNYTIVHLIRYQKDLVARLCVVLPGPAPDPAIADLTAVLADYVGQYMLTQRGGDYSSNSAFGVLAGDLIELRLTDPVELEQRLKQIQLAVKRYYHVMVIAFSPQERRHSIPWNYIINCLERIFPFSNITTYHGEILLLIRKSNRGNKLEINRDGLMQILERHNGYAAVGNFSEFLTSLPPLYHQTRNILRIGRVMAPKERIYYYEDYAIFQTVEMAAEMTWQQLGSRNPVYLCTPSYIALALYDKKTGSNLTEVLYTYLIHERNITETARALYIHRNTMLYKVRKIEEIIGTKLDDPRLRERLLYSHRVTQYMRDYRKEDVLVLKPNRKKRPEEESKTT